MPLDLILMVILDGLPRWVRVKVKAIPALGVKLGHPDTLIVSINSALFVSYEDFG